MCEFMEFVDMLGVTPETRKRQIVSVYQLRSEAEPQEVGGATRADILRGVCSNRRQLPYESAYRSSRMRLLGLSFSSSAKPTRNGQTR